jgi:hypothetical protein
VLDLWLPQDEGRRDELPPDEAIAEANRWLARVESLLKRPGQPARPAPAVTTPQAAAPPSQAPPEPPPEPPPWEDPPSAADPDRDPEAPPLFRNLGEDRPEDEEDAA